jgi:hypothetical protein
MSENQANIIEDGMGSQAYFGVRIIWNAAAWRRFGRLPALPPDVRWRLRPTVHCFTKIPGLRPKLGHSPKQCR